jgi:outer membrane murein-binding lipoprotein Lpp
MINPLDDLKFSKNNKGLDELEKLAGFSPSAKHKNLIEDVASKLTRKGEKPAENSGIQNDRHWKTHKVFADLYEKNGRPFGMFVGDLLDIILSGPVQTRLVNEMIEEKINRMRKAREAKAEVPTHKVNVPGKRNARFDVNIGGEKRIFPRNFLKRKGFLAALFIDSEEYSSFKKLIKQIETVCAEELNEPLPESEEQRKEALEAIVAELKYEIKAADVIKAWALLEADCFKNLDWIYNATRNFHLVRPNFYDDLDKAYREGKKLIKLLIEEFSNEFPPEADKQDAIIDYLNDILEIYTHHHFVTKFFHQTRPSVSLKDFEMTREELNEKIDDLREETEELRSKIRQLTIERDSCSAEARALKNQNEEVRQKLEKLDPVEVQKQLKSFEAGTNAAKRELQATIEQYTELRSDFRKLDEENQELTKKLQQLHAIPDETAYDVNGLLAGKRVAIFGGVGRDHYWPILKEAGVQDSDYEWYEGYHTISQSRTAEIVGRCDLVVVVTSYAGHLLLYQVRPCIKENQHFFKIHNSGAGSLRKEIVNTFKK